MEFKGTSLISVGIGPRNYDANYVEVGVPDDSLSGNMLFIAEKMGINLPLMPIGTMKEIQILSHEASCKTKFLSKIAFLKYV
jgi:hypothetical protein